MTITRRKFVGGVTALGGASILPAISAQKITLAPQTTHSRLPRKQDFTIPEGVTYQAAEKVILARFKESIREPASGQRNS